VLDYGRQAKNDLWKGGKKLTLIVASRRAAGSTRHTPRRAGEDDGMAYRLGADRWGFIAVETGMGKAEVDWL